jgi:uncharacterized protein (DUF2126 family)
MRSVSKCTSAVHRAPTGGGGEPDQRTALSGTGRDPETRPSDRVASAHPVRARAVSPVAYEVRDGKARYDGRTLSQWVPEIMQRLVGRCLWATEDLVAARHSADDTEVAPRVACSLAQQAAEKAIKAMLVSSALDDATSRDAGPVELDVAPDERRQHGLPLRPTSRPRRPPPAAGSCGGP